MVEKDPKGTSAAADAGDASSAAPPPAANSHDTPPSPLKSTPAEAALPSFYFEPPYKYSNKTTDFQRKITTPPLEWLCRTWAVTHSTLAMWRDARNVRITYTALDSSTDDKHTWVDDLVEYEPIKSAKPACKSVEGVDKSTETGWRWRGKSWLFFVTSHWEILGWGEVLSPDGKEVVERWVVTWFAPTTFTKEGIDFYSDRPGGMSEETYDKIMKGLEELGYEKRQARKEGSWDSVKGLYLSPQADAWKMLWEDMKEVEIKLPWTQRPPPSRWF